MAYEYKRQTADAIELSEADEKANQEFFELIKNDIRRTVKELKDAGYTDEQIRKAFKTDTTHLFYGVQSYRPGGIVAADFKPEFKTVDGVVRVCTNANQAEAVILDTQKIKEALKIL